MGKGTTKLCVFCYCSFYPSTRGEVANKKLFHPHFTELCTQLLDTPAPAPDSFDDQLCSVCHNCLPLMSSVLDINKNVFPVEKRVRRLQTQLARELKKLELLIDDLYDEMKKIGQVIRDSEGQLEEIKSKAGHDDCTNLRLFRANVLRVVNDLAVFRGRLGSKVECLRKGNTLPTPNSGVAPCAEFGDADDLIKIEPAEEQLGDDNDSDVRMQIGEDDDSDSETDFKPESSTTTNDLNKRVRLQNKNQACRKRTTRLKTSPPIVISKMNRYMKYNGRKITTIQYLANEIEDFPMNPVHTSSLSPFTKKVVLRVLRRKQKVLKRRKVRETHPDLEYEDHDWRRFFELHLIEYNQDERVLTVGGIDIKINDNQKNDSSTTENFLSCGECGHQIADNPDPKKKTPNTEHLMYEHILGAHLNAYQCTFCNVLLANHQSYFVHSKKHRKEFQCDLCGKQTPSTISLKRHKFTTHMTPEEKCSAEAVGGKSHPQQKRYQCPQCPTSLTTSQSLRDHMSTHRDRQERETPCPDCGKIMVPSSMYMHRRYYCDNNADNQPRITCPHCPGLTLKNKMTLYFHLKRTHSSSIDTPPNYLCDVCPKRFKSAGKLNTHAKSHDTCRPWICSKLCGWKFKNQKSLRRHEALCEGEGSRHRPAGGKKFQQSFGC